MQALEQQLELQLAMLANLGYAPLSAKKCRGGAISLFSRKPSKGPKAAEDLAKLRGGDPDVPGPPLWRPRPLHRVEDAGLRAQLAQKRWQRGRRVE